MTFSRLTPQIAPLGEQAYANIVPHAALGFGERQAVFSAAHPGAEEFVILTEEGLAAHDCAPVKELAISNTREDCVYAGIGGQALLLSGRLIHPDSPRLQRFHDSFYATTQRYWEELDLMGDNNPVKHAKIKTSGTTDHSAIVAFGQDRLDPFQPGEHTPAYQNTSWSPKHGFTTESAVRAVFHVVSLQKLLGTN